MCVVQEGLKLLLDTTIKFLCGAPQTLISVKQKVKAAGHEWPEIQLEEEWGGESAAGKTVLTHHGDFDIYININGGVSGVRSCSIPRQAKRLRRWHGSWTRQVDATVLGAGALGLIAHHFHWSLPPGVAVGGVLDPSGVLGSLRGVTSEHVECAERAGVQRLFISPQTDIDGAAGDPPVLVRRVTDVFELIKGVWEEGR
jgi:hypothetical protein